MKIVIQTQIRENYGAHDWDGVGDCPQYWKCKGGNTYVVNNVTVEQAQDEAFWQSLSTSVTSKCDFFEEYTISSSLVDECDFVLGNFIDPWESPITMEKDLFTSGFVALKTTMVRGIERWLQIGGEMKDYSSSLCL
tara:strand:+ start:26 stop:433 length:408 start_codon:yes stop_codon:yes gene_type:complete